MPPALRREVVAWLGPGRLWELYGSSETGTITVLPPEDQLAHPDTVGRPVAGVELRLDGDGDAPAEVLVRSPSVMAGYWDRDRGEAAWPGSADGFLSVGDLGRLDPGGRLQLVDRAGDTIISGGVNVYPAEVERVIGEHPGVAGAVVVGVADPDWQERVAAVVALASGARVDEEELRGFLSARLAPHKRPGRILFVALDDLPLGPSGKPLRRLAVRLLESGRS
jgi:acyl-CoA synthetase (AMP-forming)/AMP-acid ligase II